MSERRDPLQCTFEDAERNHLRDGMRMSVRGKIEFFEEMLDLAWRTGAAQRAERAIGSGSFTAEGTGGFRTRAQRRK